ncbi:spore coat protein [Paenibacillus solani]|uniref:Coat protein F n=1 Tax=Paenibacillus solani TaxID=1705565 RepID=A0A0M1NJL9_9BACL|nr:spore coat protein [Paenibacillus solani]KOR82312.1 coat protein F [Paenibacillus solani]
MTTMNGTSYLPEEDMLSPILGELKRTVREYTTATTEASCPVVRQMFTDLTADTLKLQGEFFNMMKQQNMYSPGLHALKTDVDKQHKQAQQTIQKTRDTINQKTSGMGAFAHHPNVTPHATNVEPSPYN